MTEPIRVDELASDDRMLDMVASRTYDGADPLASMLLSFARACDNPSPSAATRAKRRSGGRFAFGTLTTAAMLVSGAGVAAAVTDHVPDGVASWTAEISTWWGGLPGIAADRGTANSATSGNPAGTSGVEGGQAAAVPSSSTAAAIAEPGQAGSVLVSGSVEPGSVGARAPPAPTFAPAPALPHGEPVLTPRTPDVVDAAPGKSGAAPGRTTVPGEAGDRSPGPSAPKPGKGKTSLQTSSP